MRTGSTVVVKRDSGTALLQSDSGDTRGYEVSRAATRMT
jgi:hypothetical protein